MLTRWTEAMRSAFGYVIQAVDEELSGVESLTMYRAGGGTIRTQDWYTLRRAAVGSIEAADYIGAMRGDAIVPDMARATVDQNFSMKYKTTGEFFTVDPITGKRELEVISVMSNEVQPLSEEMAALSKSALSYGVDTTAENVEIGRVMFYRRQV